MGRSNDFIPRKEFADAMSQRVRKRSCGMYPCHVGNQILGKAIAQGANNTGSALEMLENAEAGGQHFLGRKDW
jgi:hypothetical protein